MSYYKEFWETHGGSTCTIRVVECGTTAQTHSNQPDRKITHKDPFVPILGHLVLFTRAAAQSLLPHLGPVFTASKEKHFQTRLSPSDAARAVTFSGTDNTLRSKVSDPRVFAVLKGLCISRSRQFASSSLQSCTGPVKKIIHLRNAQSIPMKYTKVGFWVTRVTYTHKTTPKTDLSHTITNLCIRHTNSTTNQHNCL